MAPSPVHSSPSGLDVFSLQLPSYEKVNVHASVSDAATNSIMLKEPAQYVEKCPDGSENFLIACAGIVSQLPGRVELPKYLKQNVYPKLVKYDESPRTVSAVNIILSGVGRVVAQSRYLHRLATSELSIQKDLVSTNPSQAYILLKFLAGATVQPNNMMSEKNEFIRSLWALDMSSDSKTAHKLSCMTSEGVLDGFIAHDLLSSVNTDTPPANSLPQQGLLEFVKGMGFSSADAIDLMTKPEAVANWPPECRKLMLGRREHLLSRFDKNTTDRQTFLEKYLLIIPPTTKGMFDRRTNELADAFKPANRTRVKPRTKEQQRALAIKERAEKLSQAAQKRTNSPEVLVTQNRLYIYRAGETHDESSKEFIPAVVEGIQATYKGDPALRDDMQTILHYMKKLDRSVGFIPGVKQIKGSSNRFELKVLEANGLTTTSPNAKKIRIIFNWGENGGIQIVETVLRKELSLRLRRM